MQFTNDEITLIKSAALNRYLQLGFTEKDAEVLYGNFISNINKSKPKKAQLSKKAQLDEIKSRLAGLYENLRRSQGARDKSTEEDLLRRAQEALDEYEARDKSTEEDLLRKAQEARDKSMEEHQSL